VVFDEKDIPSVRAWVEIKVLCRGEENEKERGKAQRLVGGSPESAAPVQSVKDTKAGLSRGAGGGGDFFRGNISLS